MGWRRYIKETFTSRDFQKPHFHYNPKEEKATNFAKHLASDLGNFSIDDCDIIINVGGDGTIIHAQENLPNIPSFAVKPPNSNSILFNGHHRIENGVDLKKAFDRARLYDLTPLRGVIDMSDGSKIEILAYQDIVIKSFNSQAVLSEKSIDDEEPLSVMGGGWVVSTPLGSTALNETAGGKVLKLGSSKLVATIREVSNKQKRQELTKAKQLSRTFGQESAFKLNLANKTNKRETTINYDAGTILPDGQIYITGEPVFLDTSDRLIHGITITADKQEHLQRQILINKKFRTNTI